MKTEISLAEAIASIPKGKQSILLYYNVRGWSGSFSSEPYASTPTGKLWKEGFPRVVKITRNGLIKPTKLLTI